MSQENVQVVQRGVEAWQRDDLESFLATIDPAVEWYAAMERLIEGTGSFYRGHEGMRRLWHSYRAELQDFELEAHELRDLADDRVLVLGHFRWRGATSRVVVESPIGFVITVSRGTIVRSHDYLNHQEALEAAGRGESPVSVNLDLVRSIYADWERGDYSRADWAHPEIEFVLADGPDPGRWVGLEGMAAAWRSRLTFADDLRTIGDNYRELDDERVLVVFHHTGRGKVSGIELANTRGGQTSSTSATDE